jgi:hypothetical protein
LIGASDQTTKETLTPPIKPQQQWTVLDAGEADGEQVPSLTVGLTGLHGFRPEEPKVHQVKQKIMSRNRLKHNNRATKNKAIEGTVQPITSHGQSGEATSTLQLNATGPGKLPRELLAAIEGDQLKTAGDSLLASMYGMMANGPTSQ